MTNPYQLCESIGRRATEELFGNYYIFNFTADEYNRVDFLATGLTLSCPTYVGEIKHYNQERSLRKFENYMIDYNKLEDAQDILLALGRVANNYRFRLKDPEGLLDKLMLKYY